MDIKTREEFECEMCLGEGYYPVRNGSDDFDYEFCKCPAGERLQEEAAQKVEAHFPLSASAALEWFDAPAPFEI